jgi:RNA-binding protein
MNGKQRKYLRGLAHALRPAVQIGSRGLGGSVVPHIDQVLRDHELIKVKVADDCPIDRKDIGRELHQQLGCEVAGTIGRVVILYRADPDKPRIQLPADSTPASPDKIGAATNGGSPCPTTND